MANFTNTQIGAEVALAANWLSQNECVGIPTETVYGLAANALQETAVAKIFAIKNRPSFDPLIVHVPSIDSVWNWVSEFPAPLQLLARHFWPGPLTLLLPKKDIIPDLVTSGLPDVAIRVPAHPLTQQLLAALPFPLAAPSANPFGYISPTTAQHVADQLGGKVPYILDGGPCTIGLESTIVGWQDGEVVVYRLGGMGLEALEEVTGKIRLNINQSSNPLAPGMLKSHYAPRKPLYLNNLEENLEKFKGKKISLLCLGVGPNLGAEIQKVSLSEQGDLIEAARRLFGALRQLDAGDSDLIIALSVPEEGLGKAINDRLRRAAAV